MRCCLQAGQRSTSRRSAAHASRAAAHSPVLQGSPTLRTLSKETYRHSLAVTGECPALHYLLLPRIPGGPVGLSIPAEPWAGRRLGLPCVVDRGRHGLGSLVRSTCTLQHGCQRGNGASSWLGLLAGVCLLASSRRSAVTVPAPSSPMQPCGPAWTAPPSCTRSTSAALRSCGRMQRRALRPVWHPSGACLPGCQGWLADSRACMGSEGAVDRSA